MLARTPQQLLIWTAISRRNVADILTNVWDTLAVERTASESAFFLKLQLTSRLLSNLCCRLSLGRSITNLICSKCVENSAALIYAILCNTTICCCTFLLHWRLSPRNDRKVMRSRSTSSRKRSHKEEEKTWKLMMHPMEQVGECFNLKDGRWTLMDFQSLWNVYKYFLELARSFALTETLNCFTMSSSRIETKTLAAAAHAALSV